MMGEAYLKNYVTDANMAAQQQYFTDLSAETEIKRSWLLDNYYNTNWYFCNDKALCNRKIDIDTF